MYHIWGYGNNYALDLIQPVFFLNIFGEKRSWRANRREGKDEYPEKVILNIEKEA